MKKRNRTWKCALSAALACALLLGTLPAAAFATEGPGLTPPAATAAPETTAAPEATAMPEGFEEPKATEEPKETEEPKATEEPEGTPAPQATEEPEATAGPSPEPEGTPAPEAAPENELLLAQPRMMAQKKTVIEETANLTELNIWVDELGLTHYEDSVGRGRFDGFVVADWTGKWSSSDETVVSFGAKTGLYATFVAVNPGSAVITHTGEGFGVNRGKTYVTYYPITVTESSYDFRLSADSSSNVTVYYAADGTGSSALQALTPGETLHAYDRAYKKNGAHFYVSVPAGYTGTSSFEHRSGANAGELGKYGPGVYDVLDSGSAAGAAAAAQGASMMFEYNWFEYGADYRFREFEITAEPVDITVKFMVNGVEKQSTLHHHSNLGRGDSVVTFPEAPKKDGFNFVGWQCSSNDQVFTGASASVDEMWVNTRDTAVTYTLTALWSESKPEYNIEGLPGNGTLKQVYNGYPIAFNPTLSYGDKPVGAVEWKYEKKVKGNYEPLAGKPEVTHVGDSCTIRVTAMVGGEKAAQSGDITLAVTARPIWLVGTYVRDYIYNGMPRILDRDTKDDLRYIISSTLSNTGERGLITEKDRLALVNGKELPESTSVRPVTEYKYRLSDFQVYDRTTGQVSKDYKLMAKNQNVSITLEILARELEIVLSDAQKTYGESDPAEFAYTTEVATVKGGQFYDRDKLVPGHTVTLAPGEALTRESGEDVKTGGYAISGTPGQFRVLDKNNQDVTSNYSITVKNGAFTIDPRTALIVVGNASKTEGEADPAFTARSDDLVPGETLEVLQNGLTRDAGEAVGRYDIYPSNAEELAKSFKVSANGMDRTGNYRFEVRPGVLTINPAPTTPPATGTTTEPGATPAPPAAVIPAPLAPAAGPAAVAPPEEEIPEEEVPLAQTPEAEPEPSAAPAEEEIPDDEVPLAAGAGGAWALLNLLLAVFTVLGSALLLITWATGKKRRELESETEQQRRRHGLMRLVSLVPAVASVAAFLLTENMRLPMVFADRWTILMAILAAAQLAVMFLARKNWEDQADDNGQGAAPANA